MRKTIYLLAFLFISIITAYSQNQIIPEQKIYQDSTGKIFVNKALPLYFKISQNKSENSEHKLLISQSNPDESNPLFLYKEGLNTFYSPSAVDTITKEIVRPKRDVVFELYADSHAPQTKINNNITAYDKGDTLFFGKDLKIWFASNDKLSGVENIYYSINNEDYQEYLYDTLNFFEHGKSYLIKYYATDFTGNYEDPKSVNFTIDTARPLTNLLIIGDHVNNIVASNCKVSLKPQDAFSGNAKTYYYIDNQEKTIYTTPINVGTLREGKHILHYFSQDNVNNIEEEKSYEFYIDRTPPMLIDEIIGDYIYINGKAYTSGRSQMQLSAIDNKSGVKEIFYSFDGKEWSKYEKPFLLPTSDQNIKVYYYAVDNVGNKTDFDINNTMSTKLFASQMDLTPPDILHKFTGPQVTFFDTVFISSKTQISLSANDDLAGLKSISYQINEVENFEYQNAFTIENEGYYKVTAFATDNVNNIANSDFYVMVDTTAPEIFLHYSFNPAKINGETVYPKGTQIYFAATDQQTGVKNISYKINGSSEKTYLSYLTFSEPGEYNISIKATDNLGNTGVENFSFKIQ